MVFIINKKRLILWWILGIFLFLVLVGVTLQFTVANNTNKKNAQKQKANVPLKLFKFPQKFKIKLKDKNKKNTILFNLSIAYEESNLFLARELRDRSNQLSNMVELIVTSKSKKKLETITGQLNIGEEIKAYTNYILSNGKIREVYIREFEID